ncbi:MAG: serine--tRNA ligase, partial [Clostridia bacterium]|nr:serine--tRNA ligase [Clostridia bacterium]
MLDIKLIKENTEEVLQLLQNKGKDAKEEIARILELDAERREIIGRSEKIKAEQNKQNKLIPQYKKEGKDVAPIFAEMKKLGEQVKADGEKLKEIEEEFTALMLSLPNLPDKDLLPGGKENN